MSSHRWRQPVGMTPELPSARVERQWSAVKSGVAKGRRSWLRAGAIGLGFAASAALAAFVWLSRGSVEERPMAAAPDQPSESMEHVLSDGSRIVSTPTTSTRTLQDSSEAVTIELTRGRGTFDVRRRPERRFTVVAGDVEVVVIGTRFSVTREDGRVSVEVERGRVEVHRGDEVTALVAGEEWSGPAHPEVRAEDPQERARDPREASPRDDRARTTARGRALFEDAQAARRGGDPSRAAALFDQLVRDHPRDPRAGLAAFELGRLRMDVFHDDRAAAAAFERALSLRIHGDLRESAHARLVRAYDQLGSPRCARARASFLAAYPSGSLREDVGARCRER